MWIQRYPLTCEQLCSILFTYQHHNVKHKRKCSQIGLNIRCENKFFVIAIWHLHSSRIRKWFLSRFTTQHTRQRDDKVENLKICKCYQLSNHWIIESLATAAVVASLVRFYTPTDTKIISWNFLIIYLKMISSYFESASWAASLIERKTLTKIEFNWLWNDGEMRECE